MVFGVVSNKGNWNKTESKYVNSESEHNVAILVPDEISPVEPVKMFNYGTSTPEHNEGVNCDTIGTDNSAELALAEAMDRNEIENEILVRKSADEAELNEGLDRVEYVLESEESGSSVVNVLVEALDQAEKQHLEDLKSVAVLLFHIYQYIVFS